KSEALLKRIIEISTNKNDLVMDFHLGSGTTCAVAHKMGRRYIGIEQMDYIEDIAVERMKKVIEGEQSGISKTLTWQGGGSFVYAELKQIDTFKDAEIGKLNKNMQYLPVSEIEDEEYKISKEEIKINKAFYGLDNE
ncbi:MAG: site-specific DNA-methyltransferase, partial [Sulfurimonas sp.]|nr:site-specific DNA-methyltransferase [Sulfurimonas sp.]